MVTEVTYLCFVCFHFFSKEEMFNYDEHYPGKYEGICQNCFETRRFRRLLKKRKAGNKNSGGLSYGNV